MTLLHLAEWSGWSGLSDARELAIEHCDLDRDPLAATVRGALPRLIDPGARVHEIRVGEWKALAGGPFTSRGRVLALARATWPRFKALREADHAVGCWIGVAAGFSNRHPDRAD